MQLLTLLCVTLCQECDVTPKEVENEDVEPTVQNTIDEWIQKIQRSPRGRFGIKLVIRRLIKKQDSFLRKMLGRLVQDPNDDNFEVGEVGVTKPVYGPLISIITKVYGETKTVVGYLKSFGFFGKVLNMSPNKLDSYNGTIPPCAVTEAVKEFQLFNNLEPTGTLTRETRDQMKKERCGNPDVRCETPECLADEKSEILDRRRRSLSREKRWKVSRKSWRTNDFKFFYQGYTEDLSQDVQRKEIERALNEWKEVANVNFEETENEEEADIRIGFKSGDHGDDHPFYGPGGVLAHGFYPREGKIHFDEDEQFTANEDSGVNLYYVATHTFGHVLGIKHSDVYGAVMYPYYRGYQEDINFHKDDIDAAVSLFGVPSRLKTLEAPGEKGPQGEEGEKGEEGATGDKGAQGNNDFCSLDICLFEGATGENGANGEAGATVDSGEQGPQGPQGEKGREGSEGAPGLSGESGLKGDQGIEGNDGSAGVPGEQDCKPESCGLTLGHCYGSSSVIPTVQCREGYGAASIWRNTRFWGLKCCKIIVKQ